VEQNRKGSQNPPSVVVPAEEEHIKNYNIHVYITKLTNCIMQKVSKWHKIPLNLNQFVR